MSRRKRSSLSDDAVDAAIDELDDVGLAIRGAMRLALAGEQDERPTLVTIEVAAILRFTADALDRVLRRLDPARDAP